MADRLIELALNSPIENGEAALASLLDRLLVVLSSMAPDDPALNPQRFHGVVERWRGMLSPGADIAEAIAFGPGVMTECERYFGRVKAYEGEREAEVAEVMGVVREVLRTLHGGAAAFEQGFAASASQFARMGDIADLRELRRSLTAEVQTLRSLVSTRKAQEELTFKTLSSRVERLEASLSEARDEASKDGLTGLANRRTFDRTLIRLLARTAPVRAPFTLALLDVDDFKGINDEHGHPIGDRVLVCVAGILANRMRTNDFVARYGGEEFAIVMDRTGISQARVPLQRLIDNLAPSYDYDHEGQPRSVSFTFSIGATEFVDGDSTEEIVRRADEALYRAKRKGKHRLEITTQNLLKRLLG